MSTPGRLLEVQALDLEADALRRKRKTLPERETLVSNEEEHTALVTQRAEVQARHDALARAERELGGEVESIANKARDVEANLYSGTVTVPKELDGLQQELALLKGKQDEAEGRELELLEQIEAVDAELAALIERVAPRVDYRCGGSPRRRDRRPGRVGVRAARGTRRVAACRL